MVLSVLLLVTWYCLSFLWPLLSVLLTFGHDIVCPSLMATVLSVLLLAMVLSVDSSFGHGIKRPASFVHGIVCPSFGHGIVCPSFGRWYHQTVLYII